jgi:hypothetical protein
MDSHPVLFSNPLGPATKGTYVSRDVYDSGKKPRPKQRNHDSIGPSVFVRGSYNILGPEREAITVVGGVYV